MAESDQPATRSRRPYFLTFFSLLAIGGLVAMPLLAGKPGEAEMPDIIRFLGHFHPVLLHLPIGVFVLILCQELGAIFGGRGKVRQPTPLFPMFFGAATAILAVIAGFLLYHGHADDYGGDPLAERHLWGGLVFAVAAVFTFIVKAWTLSLAANPAWYRLLLFGSVGVMGFASHDGASITHGSDYLTKYAPDPLRKILGLDAAKPAAPVKAPAEQVVYADIIAPIFERRCVSCHKEGKSKGKFRMDTYEMLVKGGKEGPGIEPGNAAESNILIRIELPEDDDEHMPPEGKPDLEAAEVAVLRWWLDSGADPAKKLSEFEVPAEIKEALAKLPTTGPVEDGAEPDGHAETAEGGLPDDSLKSAVAGLAKEFPGAIAFESQESSLVTFTAVSMRGKLDDETFGKLGPVLPHLATVDLSATKITDKSVAALEAAKNLRQVRLSETAVTDSAVDTLLKLENLESINFYGTKVTDAGIQKLSALPNLKRLYLWQTAVTPDAVKAFKEKAPKVEVITGS
jgi:uncharacterized membrane protein/mono/diheme cytochrome c family protein